ncbi:hypothetical protein CI109_107118 [Kwoniella shandongensis]|uniref:Dolichol-phosphate mannosyltransferase n=1 Tax=Kwoniella shandongensis TaxID=1734106 RepID=A0AAJ8MYY7_9TREE
MSSSPPSSLNGVLSTFKCGQYTYPIFTSGDLNATRAVIFIGGLTNGLGGVPYSYALSEALGKAGWKFVQFHWSSAYGGYGTGSLDRDRDEMAQLVKHLRANGLSTIIIMGHSTGSQNVIHYLSSSTHASDPETQVQGGIMQAPVSDREFMPLIGMTDHINAVPLAERMISEGRGDELMPKDFREKAGFGQGELAINAYRLRSLVGVGGDDDYFSSDIPLDPTPPFKHSLSDSFGVLSAPALALYSEKDAPYQVAKPEDLLPRWAEAAKGKLEWRILKGASHEVPEPEAQVIVCEEVVGWLKRFE